jgi:hypothetical protein
MPIGVVGMILGRLLSPEEKAILDWEGYVCTSALCLARWEGTLKVMGGVGFTGKS